MDPSPRLGGIPILKFTLVYEGSLHASGSSSTNQEKWAIRKQLDPQLTQLWQTHPALKRALENRVIPRHQEFTVTDVHHQSSTVAYTPVVGPNDLDLCASFAVSEVDFRPLVRSTYALACSLDILFMRKGEIGAIHSSGDLDNRIKTLLDALSVPKDNQVLDKSQKHMHVLLEDDRLVTGLNVQTRQLLDRPGAKENEVRLVIDVTVSVLDARLYNTLFLGD